VIREQLKTILRKSERVFHTDMLYLATGGFWLTAGRAVSAASGFLIALSIANLIPVETFGIYKYILAWLGIFSITTLLGLNTAVVRAVGQGTEGIVKVALRAKMRWGSIGTLAAFCISAYYYLQGNETLAMGMLLVGLFVPFYDTFAIYHAYLTGKRMFAYQTRNAIVTNVAVTIALISVLFLSDNVLVILGTYLSTWTSLRAFFYFVTVRQVIPNDQTDEQTIGYGKHLSVMKGISTAASSVGGILIFQFLGAPSLAVYAIAIAPIEQMRSLVRLAESLLLPKVSSASWAIGSPLKFLRRVSPFFIVLICLSIVYAMVAPAFFATFFPKYIAATMLSQLYVTSLVFSGAVVLFQSILKAKGRIKELYINTLIANVLHITIVPVAIVLAGLPGIIVALIANKVVLAFSAMLLAMRNDR